MLHRSYWELFTAERHLHLYLYVCICICVSVSASVYHPYTVQLTVRVSGLRKYSHLTLGPSGVSKVSLVQILHILKAIPMNFFCSSIMLSHQDATYFSYFVNSHLTESSYYL